MSNTSPALLIGRTLAGKYKIENLLGSGAMGAVYSASQLSLDKRVAVKILHAELAEKTNFVERFKIEALSASRLDHPNSLRVLDFGEDEGLLYFVMEFVLAEDLLSVLEREWPLESGRVTRIMSQALGALAMAHDLGIIHRDLKPENILVMRGEDDEGKPIDVVKVCDFGIAKMASRTMDESKRFAPQLTMEGLVVGTPDYMSPEQARGHAIDGRSDLYSMGVVLFHMLAGRPPFIGDSPLGIALQHVSEEPPRPSQFAAVDAQLEEICLRALQKRPSDRFATARDMRRALTAPPPVQESVTPAPSTSTVVPPAPAQRPRHHRTAALALLAFFAAIIWFVARKTPVLPPEASSATLVPPPSAPANTLPPESSSLATEPPLLVPGSPTELPLADRPAAKQVARERPRPSGNTGVVRALGDRSTSVEHRAEKVVVANAPPAPIVPEPQPSPVPTAPSRIEARPSTSPPDHTETPAPFDPNRATVGISSVTTSAGISGTQVRAAVSHAPLSSCYKNALMAKNAPVPLQAQATLTIDMTGRVTEASLSRDAELPGLRACVEAALRNLKIRDVDTGDGTATVHLAFVAP